MCKFFYFIFFPIDYLSMFSYPHDRCFLLNPTQIKKLLSLYYAADFDSPLSPELLKIVASRATLNEKSDILMLDLELGPDFTKPNIRGVEHIEKFVPAWISLPHISAVIG